MLKNSSNYAILFLRPCYFINTEPLRVSNVNFKYRIKRNRCLLHGRNTFPKAASLYTFPDQNPYVDKKIIQNEI